MAKHQERKPTLYTLEIEATDEDMKSIQRFLKRWVRGANTVEGSSWRIEERSLE